MSKPAARLLLATAATAFIATAAHAGPATPDIAMNGIVPAQPQPGGAAEHSVPQNQVPEPASLPLLVLAVAEALIVMSLVGMAPSALRRRRASAARAA